MEFFSHVHPITPLIIYLPVIGFMLQFAVGHAMTMGAMYWLPRPRSLYLEPGRIHDAPLGFPL